MTREAGSSVLASSFFGESRRASEADEFFRWFDREAPIQEVETERAFRELRESVRRR